MLVRAASLLIALGVPWACSWGAPPLTVCSGGAKPIQLTMAKLSKLPQLTITVTFKTSRGLSTGSFTGPSLWTVLTDAQALDPTKPRGFVGDTILTTG